MKKYTNQELLLSSEKFVLQQLTNYYNLIRQGKANLLEHNQKVYQIKKRIGIFSKDYSVDSLADYTILEKPILLVGDCTQPWIDDFTPAINDRIRDVAFGAVYQGSTNTNFWIPWKSSKNKVRLD